MSTPYFPKARTGGLVTQDFDKELLVYDLQTDRAHCLNETAAAVWRACDGTKSVNEIAAAVGR
ncbi:PqqD family protein, partial [Escherichia coli]|nr:PqqD family protein [Escherichia coli]